MPPADGSQAPPDYDTWQDAALGGNLLSYAWKNRPGLNDQVPDSKPGDPWWQKALDVASIPARLGTNALLGPIATGGKAMDSWMKGDQSQATRDSITRAVMGLLGQGLSSAPTRLGTPGPLASFTGWHGTPHDFSEFQNEAIGSGEGAQAYGWGHYVAGNPKVATSYKTAGQQSNYQITHNGIPLPSNQVADNPMSIAQYYLHQAGTLDEPGKPSVPYTDHAIEILDDDIKQPMPVQQRQNLQSALDWIEQNKNQLGIKENPGNLLEVHIKPEEHELLDWDAPLVKQSLGVQEKLQDLAGKIKENDSGSYFGHTIVHGSAPAGETIYKNLGIDLTKDSNTARPDQAASMALHEAGIPGIKYLDAGSRQPPDIAALQNQLDYHQRMLDKVQRIQAAGGDMKSQIETYSGLKDQSARQLEAAKAWQPTRNYVIFHPSNLQIIGKNGQRFEMQSVQDDPFQPTEGASK